MQRVLQAATAENDNPDIRDRAYVYWRLLSSDPQIAKNVVLSARPGITSTIPVLPAPLLESLLPNLSTLASVYQKPPQTFLGQGRSSALQAAAIEEAKENARENPIAAAAVSAAVAGTASGSLTNNAENLLDIDFDGAAPASMQTAPESGASGLEGLAGTPQRVASPSIASQQRSAGGGMDDLMGMFGGPSNPNGDFANVGGNMDLMNGFATMDLNVGQGSQTAAQPNNAAASQGNNDDLLGLF